jgi:hypothetical protein
MCGDATDDLITLLAGVSVGGAIMDPPYGMRLDTDFSGMRNKLRFAQEKGVRSGRNYVAVRGDDVDYDAGPLRAQLDCEQVWFGADYYATTLGDTSHSGAWLVWDKRVDEQADKMFGSCFELIWTNRKCRREILRYKWAGIFGTEHEPVRGREHPTQKPVPLMVALIGRFDGCVVDPYAGAGTTIIAAEQLSRVCYAMEIEPAYCDVIRRRYAEFVNDPKLAP